MKKTNGKVSAAVIRRLPRYYDHLSELRQQGVVRMSSGALGKSMGLTASQIRQDLFCFGGFGQQGYGYNVERLREEIGSILGIDRGHTAVVLGVGHLGHALLRNFRFGENGFHVEAAFDIDDSVIGTTVAITSRSFSLKVVPVSTISTITSESPMMGAISILPLR